MIWPVFQWFVIALFYRCESIRHDSNECDNIVIVVVVVIVIIIIIIIIIIIWWNNYL